ncbi:ABC transporter permease [Brevibacillus centrosporus]|jgi:oligopeptide transport system permease protein|uniref:Oligopeptide transport system permease protein n=1 Tax=Brevibacillus centrosporus TaxID=54910 RepID=A0A1I3ZHF9_9BACL|nr:ABC transporter permease [Brevibacillus centrosporus]MEC2132839.1 ABC transporter permease [Brevibacillus centrosporus]MED1954159.1 ABC transporter permease [Brevibacillus centrosporus]MED4911588.1 ABC transporter permease [Brevibacillus centrosporus]RNB64289.1 ABC transporter permease [Brevibacillus centrosporus]SFK43350.1 oligopeptide transport system permease protein [Brevibacillus centrosporus]
MAGYIVKRFFASILTMFVLITITFFLMHAVPGGPFSPAEERKVPKSVMEKMEEKFGLNEPLGVQYVNYLKSIAQGDLGISFKQSDVTVNELISRGFPVSAKVGLIAIVIALIVGMLLGITSAIKRGKWPDWLSMIVATIGISIPNFVMTVLMLFLFVVVMKLLPSYGLSSWKHYILPVAGLAFGPIAYIARLMRSSMLEVMRQDYILTARAKGVPEYRVIFKHALKNAIIPIVTYLGPLVAALLTGSFIVERIFSIPGIGRDFVSGISDRDYSVILGLTVFLGIFIIISNFIVDILYAIIDKRVKIEE